MTVTSIRETRVGHYGYPGGYSPYEERPPVEAPEPVIEAAVTPMAEPALESVVAADAAIDEPAEPPAGSHAVRGGIESVLTALADPTRRVLLDILATLGEGTATMLAARLPVTRQAVVKHLAVLDAAGLVTGGRVGREVRYVVCPNRLEEAAEWLSRLATDWANRGSAS